jgi:predicted Zn-dependent protease
LLGYKVEHGEIVSRVKNTIVAGNVHEALSRVAAIGRGNSLDKRLGSRRHL